MTSTGAYLTAIEFALQSAKSRPRGTWVSRGRKFGEETRRSVTINRFSVGAMLGIYAERAIVGC
jgi:hypothetical protein